MNKPQKTIVKCYIYDIYDGYIIKTEDVGKTISADAGYNNVDLRLLLKEEKDNPDYESEMVVYNDYIEKLKRKEKTRELKLLRELKRKYPNEND